MRKVLSLLFFLSVAPACFAVFCEERLGLSSKLRVDGQVRIGDQMWLEVPGEEKRQSIFFMGRRDSKLFFMGPQQLLFLSPEQATKGGVENALWQEMPPATGPDFFENLCAPCSILSSLEWLAAKGKLSDPALVARLSADRLGFMRELDQIFGQNHIAELTSKKVAEVRARGYRPKKERRRLKIEARDVQYQLIVSTLKGFNVSAKKTRSLGALLRHLRAGWPAYISYDVRLDTYDYLNPWTSEVILQAQSLPTWWRAPSMSGRHAVMAFGVVHEKILRNAILVHDSYTGHFAPIRAELFYLLGDANFILIYPSTR